MFTWSQKPALGAVPQDSATLFYETWKSQIRLGWPATANILILLLTYVFWRSKFSCLRDKHMTKPSHFRSPYLLFASESLQLRLA